LSIVVRHPTFLIAIAVHGLFLFLACRAALRYRSADPKPQSEGWVRIALLASLLPLTLLSLLSIDNEHPNAPLFGKETLASPLGSVEEIVARKIKLLIWHHEQGYRRRAARPSTHVTAPMLAIFIVGESVRADGYGPNQEDRGPASRQLAQRIDAGLGSWLPTTCASADGTYLSVPMLLTGTPPSSRDEAAAAPTVLGILHADGFSTAWLANNESGGDGRERGHDLYAGVYRINPDALDSDGLDRWKLDEDMIPAAKAFAGKVDRPKAMILHFIGSHAPYEWRYPANYFPAEPAGLGTVERADLRYARSLEYGARTLLQVAAILDSTTAPAFLVYTSDHGENLPRDHSGFLLHLGPRTNQVDGTIPSFLLWNKAMADTGRPAQALSKLTRVKQIAHADVAKLFLGLTGVMPIPVEPTIDPKIWGRISIGDPYSAVPCSALKP
jgi:glucan phosphoethanolaminetransferase (alkaline phosphatase superfamily)